MAKNSKKFDRLLRNLKPLEKYCKLKHNKHRTKFVNDCNNDFIACIVESSANVLKGNVPMKNTHKKELKKHLAFLKHISKQRDIGQARDTLSQSGGFIVSLALPILAAIATSAVSELIAKLTK